MSILGPQLAPLDTQVVFTAEPLSLSSPTSMDNSSSTRSPVSGSLDSNSADDALPTAPPSAWGRRKRKSSLPRSVPEGRRRNSSHTSVSSWLSRVGPNGRQRWSWSHGLSDKKAQTATPASHEPKDGGGNTVDGVGEGAHSGGIGSSGVSTAVPGPDATSPGGDLSATPTASTVAPVQSSRRSPWAHLHTFLTTPRSNNNNNHLSISRTTSRTSVTATQHASSSAHSPETPASPLSREDMPAPGVGQDAPGDGPSPGTRVARLPSGAPHVVFTAADKTEPTVSESPAPPSAHDAVVTELLSRPSPPRTVSSPSLTPRAPELHRSISTDSTPKQTADLAHRAKESERRDTDSDKRLVSAMMDGPLDPGGGRVTRALAAQIDAVLTAQEKIGQAHLALERIGADSLHSARPDTPTSPHKKPPAKTAEQDQPRASEKDEKDAKDAKATKEGEAREGDAAKQDKTRDVDGKASVSAEPSANDEIRRRAQGIEDIMAQLSELATSLKSYHAMGTPALVFPPSTKPHPLSGLTKPPSAARSRQPLVTIATPAVARNVPPPAAAGTLPRLKTQLDPARPSMDSESGELHGLRGSAKHGARPTFTRRQGDAVVASPAEIGSPGEIGAEHKRPW